MNGGENQIVVYQTNETVRLNRHQIAQLFGRDVKTIGKHIANCDKFRQWMLNQVAGTKEAA